MRRASSDRLGCCFAANRPSMCKGELYRQHYSMLCISEADRSHRIIIPHHQTLPTCLPYHAYPAHSIPSHTPSHNNVPSIHPFPPFPHHLHRQAKPPKQHTTFLPRHSLLQPSASAFLLVICLFHDPLIEWSKTEQETNNV